MRRRIRTTRHERGTRGSVLLEVLVTVTIIAMFMGLIGAQILASVRAAGTIEQRQEALLLAESLAARLQAGMLEMAGQAGQAAQTQQMSGLFGEAYPGWGYRLDFEPIDDQTVMRVHVEILRGDPEQTSGTAVDSLVPVLDFHTFWAVPKPIDLAADYGMSDEDIAKLTELAGIGELSGFDPYAFDPRMLASLDVEQLQQLLPLLMASGIGGLGDLGALAGLAGGGSQLDLSQLQDLLGGLGGEGGRQGEGSQGQQSQQGYSQGELERLLNSGNKQGAIDYIMEHMDEIRSQAGQGGGAGGGGRGGGGPGGGGRGRGANDQAGPSGGSGNGPPGEGEQDNQPRRNRGGGRR